MSNDLSQSQMRWPDLSDRYSTFPFSYCTPDNSPTCTVIITLHWSVRSVFPSPFIGSLALNLNSVIVDRDSMRQDHLRVYMFPIN